MAGSVRPPLICLLLKLLLSRYLAPLLTRQSHRSASSGVFEMCRVRSLAPKSHHSFRHKSSTSGELRPGCTRRRGLMTRATVKVIPDADNGHASRANLLRQQLLCPERLSHKPRIVSSASTIFLNGILCPPPISVAYLTTA